MSGTNGIRKYLPCNRDLEITNASFRGAISWNGESSIDGTSPLAITPAQLLEGQLSFGAGSTGPYTWPTGRAWQNAISVDYPHDIGYCIQVAVGNMTNAPIIIDLPGAVAGQGSMVTCDGTNQISLPACSGAFVMICKTAENSYMATPMGLASGGGAAVVTLQEAYDASKAAGDNPAVLVDDATPYRFRIQTGVNRNSTSSMYGIYDIDNLSADWQVSSNNGFGYFERPGRSYQGWYNTIGNMTRNIVEFFDNTKLNITDFGLRNHLANNWKLIGLYGSVAGGNPAYQQIGIASGSIADSVLINGTYPWYAQECHQDDPNSGWRAQNDYMVYKTIADNMTGPPPAATNLGQAAWSHFSVNHGMSLLNLENSGVPLPADTHTAPSQLEYQLGTFTLRNPVGSTAQVDVPLGKNVRAANFCITNNQEADFVSFEITLKSMDITSGSYANQAVYLSKYNLVAKTYSGVFAAGFATLTLASSTQAPNDLVNYPPPTLTLGINLPFRPDVNIRLVNGADATVAQRKFFHQIYVIRRDMIVFNRS